MSGEIYNMVQDLLQEDREEELLDFVSEGEGEPIEDIETPVKLDESFPSTVLIANVPQVGKEKFEKLLTVLGKIIDKIGPNEKYMPFNDETNLTEGFLLVTYKTPEIATKAVDTLDGYSLDKKNVFKVVMVDTFDKIVERETEFVPTRSATSFSRADLRDWLADSRCREQILLRYQTETEIYWHDTMADAPVLCYGGEREKAQKKVWCDWMVTWSPLGSYIATYHKPGIAIWGGEGFEKKARFPHANVRHLEFSPDEEFVLTWNGSHSSEKDDGAVKIWRILTGEMVKSCRTPTVAPLGGEFPHFLWSKDGKYASDCNESTIFVRDTANFDIIEDENGKKRSLKYDGLETFQWSPKDNILAIWVKENERGNTPARLVLVEIPSRKEIRSISRTQVEAKMFWQSEGDFLCLLVTKLEGKTRKRGKTSMEIFRIRDRNVPVETVDLPDVLDSVKGFFWETKGNRFAVLTSDEAGHRPKALFYEVGKEKIELLPPAFILPSANFNTVYWAPEGQYFVAAANNNGGGDLLFGSLTPEGKLELTHKDEHFMLTDVQWDPSSRYVITAVTQPMREEVGSFKYQMEAGYAIWTFQGRQIFRKQMEKLWHVSWRPHPPTLLSDGEHKDIRKNIKTYSKKYDAIDTQQKEVARNAFKKEREEKTGEFLDILRRLDEYKQEKMRDNGWDEAWDRHLEEQDWAMTETFQEEELSVTEELLQS